MSAKFDATDRPDDLDLQIIRAALRKNRNLKAMAGLVLLLAGGGVMFTQLRQLGTASALSLALLCMMVCFSGLYFLLSALLRHDLHKHHLLHTMAHHPGEVAWVYYRNTQNMPFGVSTFTLTSLHICLLNRESMCLHLGESSAAQLMELLKRRLPHATFGHSAHYEQLYDISPELLVRDG